MRGFLLACAIIAAVCVVCPADCTEIKLKYACFDPLVSLPDIPPGLVAPPVPTGEQDYIIQFDGPISGACRNALAQLGADVVDYIPDFAFAVRLSEAEAKQARYLPHVRWVGPFHPAYKLSPLLRGKNGASDVSILMSSAPDAVALAADITTHGGAADISTRPGGAPHIRATVPKGALERVAKHQGVVWVDPYVPHKLTNDVARGLLSVGQAWTAHGLYGAGEIVAVCDTGLDTGSQSTLSADFSGRVLKTYDLGRKKKWNDTDGHGTHVSGSVLGSGALSGSNPATHNYSSSFAGAAPEAQLVMQSVLSGSGGLGGIPSDLNTLFQPAYSDGARIHTNSWGAAMNGYYSLDAHNVDLFTWTNRDMVVLFAAGNEGVDANSSGVIDPDSIDSPATAKNCITVGGSESNRLSGGLQGTYGGYWPTDYPADPIKSDKVSNNPTGIVAFSSRGPTDDGRIKPDIIAPGTNIMSCRSHDSAAGALWGVYNTHYTYSGGTSMSTPLVAGCCALVREYYRTVESHTPTSALVKASLINGGTDLYPGQYGTGSYQEIPSARPNNVEGWGLVNVAYLINPPANRAFDYVDNTAGLSTGQTASNSYYVSGGSSPLRVTLVWTDYPAAAAASVTLVNDLDLTVTLPDGSVRRGNGATDRRNNVEGVDITTPTGGGYTVTVTAYNAPCGPQPFALVVSGELGSPVSVPTVSEAKNRPDGDVITLTGKLVSAVYNGVLYIQEPTRIGGIKVSLGSTPTSAAIGDTVTVTGVLQTTNGERAIVNPVVTVTSP